MMLLQPQRQAPPTSGVASSKFGRKNRSAVSLTSSSNEGYGTESSRGTSMHNNQSGSSQDHQHAPPLSPYSPQPPVPSTNDDSSDAEYTRSSLFGRRRGSSISKKQSESHDSSLTKAGSGSTKSGSSGVGTIRGLGRRLFSRTHSSLKPAPLLTSRSHSASSASTQAQSPPLTPTTPPQLIQPVWLPNGQKDFFSNFSTLPSSVHVSSQQSFGLGASNDGSLDISPETKQGEFTRTRSAYDSGKEHEFDATSSSGHDPSSTSTHMHNSLTVPSSVSSTPAASVAIHSTLPRRDIPAVIEEEGDTDFLRAVLSFGEGGDASPPSPSYRGGRAAPLPTRSSSLGQIAGIASSVSYNTPSSTPRPPVQRTPDGRVILTQAAAKDFAYEEPPPRYMLVQRKYRKGLFGDDSDSEDEYGDEDDQDNGSATNVATTIQATPTATLPAAHSETPSRFPSSFAKSSSRSHSPSGNSGNQPCRPPGLDSAAKKALYNCTLLKVHMHLAPSLAGDAQAQTLIPVIASGEVLYSNEDLKFPRSINDASKLHLHTSTYGFARNLNVALARTSVMRKLRRDRLNIDEEVEISWFQRRYGSASIPADHIAKALRQRQMVSPEALAKPPIAAAPFDSAAASGRRLSATAGIDVGKKSARTGIVTWAQRPSFLERTVEILPANDFAPGKVLFSGWKLAPRSAVASSASSPVSTVSYSPRIRVLAGLPSLQEETRTKHLLAQKSRRASRLESASEGKVWEGTDLRSSSATGSARELSFLSPPSKPKRLPPWMASRSPQLLSPGSMSQLRTPRSASDGLSALDTLHQNTSTSSIPEEGRPEEQGADSSDEEVPLAHLQTFRAQRSAERERIEKLESEIALLRQREGERDKDEEARKAREEEARRVEAERAYQERKAALEARKIERNKRILQEARERRGFTRQSMLLAEPNYGAGNPLLSPNPRPKPGSSPSSPNLSAAHEPMSPGACAGRALQHDAALSKLQGNSVASRSTATLYAQQDGQRRSRTSVVADAATSPVQGHAASTGASPGARASASGVSPLVDYHRNASMATLTGSTTQHSLPQRRSMAALPTSPQITQRRTSLRPPSHLAPMAGPGLMHPAKSMQHLAPHSPNLHHATSMHHLSPQVVPSPNMLSTSLTSGLLSPQPHLTDPRFSMSMTNLHAQTYLQAQHQAHARAQMVHPVVQGQPTMAQTAKVSSRMRPGIPAPLVSLYGGVVPSSALSTQQTSLR